MSRYGRTMELARLLLLATVSGACSGDDDPSVALDLALMPDLNINTPDQLTAQVDTVVLVVDSPDGLYEPGRELVEGSMQIKNADIDEDLELVVTSGLIDGRLPSIRLLRGSLQDVPLSLRVLGLDASDATAAPRAVGGVSGVRFGSGIEELAIPFNLLPELLPPRVMQVLPAELDCNIDQLVILFSKSIDAQSLQGSVNTDPGGAPASLIAADSGLIAHVVPRDLVGVPVGDGYRIAFRLTLSIDVTDPLGTALDQVPSESGPQPYEQDFDMPCTPSEIIRRNCGIETSEPLFCPGELACVDGFCTPQSCAGVTCALGYVCESGSCQVDCRLYGDSSGCPVEKPSCDPTTGICAQ